MPFREAGVNGGGGILPSSLIVRSLSVVPGSARRNSPMSARLRRTLQAPRCQGKRCQCDTFRAASALDPRMKRYPESSAGHITGRILLKKPLLLFAALLVAGCGEKSLSDADVERLLKEAAEVGSLEWRDDLAYQNSEPYSGWVKEMYNSGQVQSLVRLKDGKRVGLSTGWHENGQKSGEITFKDGKLHGPCTGLHENGQKSVEVTYKDGKMNGLWTTWHENGQKSAEVTYKDGKADGLMIEWHENGQKITEGTYKDAEQDGLWTRWHENGQKRSEVTFKDGKQDGLWTKWYENGQKAEEGACKGGKLDGFAAGWHENTQKALEGTYKDGELISAKYWNSKGEEVESLDEAKK